MSWLKNVVLDIAVAIIALVFVLTGQTWAWWVIVIYTPLMLLMKVGAVFAASSVKPMTGEKKKTTNAPDLFFHVIYAVMVGLFVWNQWWLMAAAWALIWLASFVYLQRARPARG